MDEILYITNNKKYIKLIPSTREHCIAIARSMRQHDIDEIYAARRMTPYAALYEGFIASNLCLTGLDKQGRLLGMFGVTQDYENVRYHVPWLLASDKIEKQWIAFLRTSKLLLPRLLQTYGRLRNYIDARNTKSIAWLKYLGFDMEEPKPYGALGLPFILFHKEAKQCVTL